MRVYIDDKFMDDLLLRRVKLENILDINQHLDGIQLQKFSDYLGILINNSQDRMNPSTILLHGITLGQIMLRSKLEKASLLTLILNEDSNDKD